MADIPITLTCADYARVLPLATGEVTPEGIDLTLELGKAGSWKMRADALRRAMNDPAVDGGEGSMAQHLRRIELGDRSFVGLPAFVLRNFVSRDLYVLKDGKVKTPRDLPGKRVGMYSWTASGSIFYRHFLRHVGVDPASIKWLVGDIDEVGTGAKPALPDGVGAPPPGQVLSKMLLDGEIDALYCPNRPNGFNLAKGPVTRLFSDVRTVDKDYFAKTGCFPPQHLIILKRATWERNPWIARSLTDAFIRCNDTFQAAQYSYPYASPWLDSELEEAAAAMGPDTHPYGIEPNRRSLEAFCEEAHRSGLAQRRVAVEELFTEFLQS